MCVYLQLTDKGYTVRVENTHGQRVSRVADDIKTTPEPDVNLFSKRRRDWKICDGNGANDASNPRYIFEFGKCRWGDWVHRESKRHQTGTGGCNDMKIGSIDAYAYTFTPQGEADHVYKRQRRYIQQSRHPTKDIVHGDQDALDHFRLAQATNCLNISPARSTGYLVSGGALFIEKH